MLKNAHSRDINDILEYTKGDVYEIVITTLNTCTVQSQMKVGMWAVNISASKNSLIIANPSLVFVSHNPDKTHWVTMLDFSGYHWFSLRNG